MVQETGLKAYKELNDNGEVTTRCFKTLETLSLFPDGLTDMELSKKMGFSDPNKVRPRRNELVKRGLVFESGKRACNVTGRLAVVWRCTDAK